MEMIGVAGLVKIMRVALVVIGTIWLLVAWNSEDRIWSPFYWIDRLWGRVDDIDVRLQEEGGMTRMLDIIASIAAILAGLFGKHWLEKVAEMLINGGLPF